MRAATAPVVLDVEDTNRTRLLLLLPPNTAPAPDAPSAPALPTLLFSRAAIASSAGSSELGTNFGIAPQLIRSGECSGARRNSEKYTRSFPGCRSKCTAFGRPSTFSSPCSSLATFGCLSNGATPRTSIPPQAPAAEEDKTGGQDSDPAARRNRVRRGPAFSPLTKPAGATGGAAAAAPLGVAPAGSRMSCQAGTGGREGARRGR
mmetsp:Transcript_2463/g.6531  ORF Transcript_2463/g.6531 Transcript_2463/m.6531 type:complete len:205 (-) Transcript_2463:130-744(-)